MAVKSSLESLRSKFDFSGQLGLWKIIAIVFALLNLKSLPFAWHIRLLKGVFTHRRSSRIRLASKSGPSALFQPMITSSRSGFLECDYNLHKSNSTYFTDFDVGRLELFVSLCAHGIEKTMKELAEESKDRFSTILGGVNCNFRREIKPYEAFEVWTRILCWDNKWLYVIGHFVKKGVVKPKAYTLQPWKRGRMTTQESNGHVHTSESAKTGSHPAIFASGIAKYVFKKGRLTIPPERVLRASELLPPRPADHATTPASMTPDGEATSINAVAASSAKSLTLDNAGEVMAASLTPSLAESVEWTWERVEEERKRGMKIAELYNGLDALNGEFSGDGMSILGQY